MQALVSVNGVDLPEPSSYSATTSTIVDSGRNVQGKVVGSVVRHDVAKVALKWKYLTANLLTSVNSLNKKIIKNLLPGAVEHPATLISRQHSLSAENHRNGSSETINRHQEMAGNAEIQ